MKLEKTRRLTTLSILACLLLFLLISCSPNDDEVVVIEEGSATTADETPTTTDTTPPTTTDTTPPTAVSVSIDSGASTTTSASVTLSLNATDDVAVTHYYASESSNAPAANASGWASYATSVSYTFDTTTSETKTIYVWFKDAAGNLSSSATGSISFSNHWPVQFGTSGNDYAHGVSVDSAGNVYVAGEAGGTFDGQSSAGEQDAFVAKYDSSGNQEWLRQLGTSGGDETTGVSVDSAGNVYVAGTTQGTFVSQSSAGGYSDAFVVKYDSAGTQQWLRQFGTSGRDDAYSVSVDGAGNVYVAGYTTGTFDDQSSAGFDDAFLVKYDSSGSQQWARQFGTSSLDYAYGVSVDSAGDVYVAGKTGGSFLGQSSTGVSDAFVAKYDSSGNQQWLRQFGSTSNEIDSPRDVSVDNAGDVYVVGHTDGTFSGQSSTGNYDAFVVKYDSSGNQQWLRQFGTSSGDFVYGVSVDNAGNLYIAGETWGTFSGETHAGGFSDAFVARFDSSGNQQWVRQLGTSDDDKPYSVSVDGAGDIYVVGETYGTFSDQSSAGSWDAFLVKYDSEGTQQ